MNNRDLKKKKKKKLKLTMQKIRKNSNNQS